LHGRFALLTVALIFSCVAAGAAMPQAAPAAAVSVRGVAFDSLRSVPLAGAFVAIAGTGRSTQSDSLGHFHFDTLPAGSYLFTLEHAALDSLGLPGVTVRVSVRSPTASIIIAIPSFATPWRAACGTSNVPRGSAFVFGTIFDAGKRDRVANAKVDVAWLDLHMTKAKTVSQRQLHIETRSDASGSYAVCGVPADVGLRIAAMTDSSASGAIDLAPQSIRVRRRDLLLGLTRAITDSAVLGTITGKLTDTSGAARPERARRAR
ncbi:MAG: carboxypeptidase regulatory-like domain-containing protein, partial [Gemmatimonadales bacterium]